MIVCPNCGEENPPRFRLCGFCGTPLAPAATVQETRKTVTVVFSDLKGSTNLGENLDSESLREVMTRYFDEFRRVLERHGGTVEKFIGDAVMAVFGLPRLHEDDALRAVRAALDMQQALARLNLELERGWGVQLANRTGVNTGEVVAGDATAGQRLVTGDTVNVAARLEQAAPENEILIGESTYRLVKDAVQVERVPPLALKGKSEPVPAYRLLAVMAGASGVARRLDAPMVGRRREMARLQETFDNAVRQRRCRLVTIVGSAGVGKSRLTEEFLSWAGQRADVLRGRCLAYGEGITFWPLAEVVRNATGARSEESRERARAKLLALVGDDSADVAERVAAAIGWSDTAFTLDETFWAIRRLLELLARRRPLVVLFDDIHWAEPTFLDVIEHVSDVAEGAPLLLVCPARQELLEERPEWTSGRRAAVEISLNRLSDAESELIVANLLGSAGVPAEVQQRICQTGEGNPLFVEQMLSVLIEDGLLTSEEGRWFVSGDLSEVEIPPTISALVTARLDRLGLEERAVMERASVVGQTFYRGAVLELCPAPIVAGVPANIATLTRKELIRPEESTFAGEETFRFHHIVIRDSAYAGLLKRTRAELHERFVEWLERLTGARVSEYEEILGYHLEQAYRYRRDLGPLDEKGRQVARRASERLASAGRRALSRRDTPATVNLLSRAAAVLEEQDPARLALIPDLAEALIDHAEFARADELLGQVIEATWESDDERLRADALIVRLLGRFSTDPEGWTDTVVDVAEDSISVLERYGDHCALAKAWRLLGSVHGMGCQYERAEEAVGRAVEESRLAGDRRQELQNLPSYALTASYGPMPVPEAIRRCEEIRVEAAEDKRAEALVLCALSHLLGMAGRFDEAREMYGRSRAMYCELGLKVNAALVSLDSAIVEMLAGDPVAAERELRADYEALKRMGEKNYLSTTAALLAHALHAQGRDDEAERFTHISEETSAPDDVNSQVEWRCARAKVLAGRGEFHEAEHLAREAVRLAMTTDFLEVQGNALMDLAEVLVPGNQPTEAAAAINQALALHEQKGNDVSAAKSRARLERLLE